MARKRMFDLDVINQNSFIDLPLDAIALYFLLGMEADDEGFVNPKRVMKLYSGKEDSIRILIAKGYLIPFETGVVVITDWKRNNYLQKDRVKPTIYQKEKSLIAYDEIEQKYLLFNKCLTNVHIDKNSIDKNSIDKNIIEKNNNKDFDDEIKEIFGDVNV